MDYIKNLGNALEDAGRIGRLPEIFRELINLHLEYLRVSPEDSEAAFYKMALEVSSCVEEAITAEALQGDIFDPKRIEATIRVAKETSDTFHQAVNSAFKKYCNKLREEQS